MPNPVDAGEAYGNPVVCTISEEQRAQGGWPIDARWQGNLVTVAYSFGEIERAELASGGHIVLTFMGGMPVHTISVEGVIYTDANQSP